jgi:hypothetical protein
MPKEQNKNIMYNKKCALWFLMANKVMYKQFKCQKQFTDQWVS